MAEGSAGSTPLVEKPQIKRDKSKSKQDTRQRLVHYKRSPPRLPKRDNDVYVNTKSSFQCQLTKCIKLIESEEKEIVIHALGAAVSLAINLGLQLQKHFQETLELSVNTSTVRVTDDVVPLCDSLDLGVQNRDLSAIHIKVYQRILANTAS